jgi:hypothetical protein
MPSGLRVADDTGFMKTKTMVLALLVSVSSLTAFAEDTAKKFWYEFKVKDQGTVAATSTLEPDNLAAALAEGGFIRFADVRYMGADGKWVAANAPYSDRLFIRREQIKSFVPMESAPKDYEPKNEKK